MNAAHEILLGGTFASGADLGCGALPGAGGTDAFVAKLSPVGACLWSKRYGDAADQTLRAVAYDAMGNVLAGGAFGGAITLGGANFTMNGAAHGGWAAKLDASGGARLEHRARQRPRRPGGHRRRCRSLRQRPARRNVRGHLRSRPRPDHQRGRGRSLHRQARPPRATPSGPRPSATSPTRRGASSSPATARARCSRRRFQGLDRSRPRRARQRRAERSLRRQARRRRDRPLVEALRRRASPDHGGPRAPRRRHRGDRRELRGHPRSRRPVVREPGRDGRVRRRPLHPLTRTANYGSERVAPLLCSRDREDPRRAHRPQTQRRPPLG